MKRKKIDFLIVVCVMLIGGGATLYFNLKPLTGSLMFAVAPSLFMFVRAPKNYKKIFWGVVIFGLVLGFVFDLIMQYNLAWETKRLVFPWLIFGIEPIDNILGYGIMTLLILTFYEHFIDDEKTKRISKRLSSAMLFGSILVFICIAIFLVNPETAKIPQAYFIGGLAAVAFPATYAFRHPRILSKFALLSIFFFFVWFLFEYIAVKTGAWIYPGNQYIGWVSIFDVTFPIEELLFWMLWYAVTVVAYYEYFIDDNR